MATRTRKQLRTEDAERMVLRGVDRKLFLKAVENPPRPTQRLIEALKRSESKKKS